MCWSNLRYPPENGPCRHQDPVLRQLRDLRGRTSALAFKRSKSKELLAYLVDRNGATCTNGEMLAVLWEDKPDTASLHSHLRNLIFDLSHTLEDAGVNGLLVRGRSTLALDTSKVDCDYYNFLRGDRSAYQFLPWRVYDPVFLGRGHPFGAAPAGRSYAQKRVYPKLLRPAHGLLKLHKTPKAAVHCCAAAFFD